MFHVYDGMGGRLKRVSHQEALDATSSTRVRPGARPTPSWIGDRVAEILERLLELTVVMPSWLKAQGFAKDRKEAYVYMQRLLKLGALEKTDRYGVYRVRHDVIARLLQLPVRRISEGLRRARERLRLLTNGGGVRRARPCGLVLPGFDGLGFVGLFVDNVRCVGNGLFRPWPGGRGVLFRVSDLGLFCSNVCYFEVCHVVGGVGLGGQVVVYSNSGDMARLGECVRVEWRPPENFVSEAGVRGTLQRSRVEFLRAWVALSVVLREGLGLPRSYLSSLYSWLGNLWGLGVRG
jgi:hypothetical protein